MPFIQQLFKRWDGGRITLAGAAISANTNSSHQKLDFSQLIDKYREFVPSAGDTTWRYNYLPVLRIARRHSVTDPQWTVKLYASRI